VRSLRIANAAFALAVVLHTTDHFRQARGLFVLDPLVLAGGSAVFVLAFASLWLTWQDHDNAPLVAMIVGAVSAVGVASSHIAPYWSRLSDPYTALDLDAYSWLVMLLEIGTAVVLAVVSAQMLNRRQQLQPKLP
jgi:hypothetical protein